MGFTYASVTPLFEASDELWHYPMVKTLADGNGLPVQDPANVGPWRQEGSQPPLYYYLAALATFWIDTRDAEEIRWLNPHVDNGVITPDGNINLAIHTPAERLPWRGTVLAMRLIRFLSVLMGAGTVYFTFRLAREVIPDRPGLALTSAAVVAFTPMFLFISGAVNNDNLAMLLSSATLWWLVRMTSRQSSVVSHQSSVANLQSLITDYRSFLSHCSLGLLLGLAALTKESTLGLFPLAAAVLAWNTLRALPSPDLHRRSRVLGFGVWDLGFRSVLVFGLAALIAGWWYWRNYVLYGDWLGLNAFIKVLGQRAAPASLAQLWSERVGFMQAYWGLFGGVNVPMSGWVYTVFNTLAVLAVIGLAVYFARLLAGEFGRRRRLAPLLTSHDSHTPEREVAHDSDQQETRPGYFPILLSFAWVAAVVISLVRWATVTWSSQGRLVFSAISAITVLFVLGLFAVVPRRAHSLFFSAVTVFFFSISAIAPFVWIAPKYADPPTLTEAQVAAIPHHLNADFGGEMKLLGYDVASDSVRPGAALTVTLYWQSQIAMDRDWSVFVHLIDENEIVVAQRDTYPGLGLLPTRRMWPGQTLADRYVIRVPAATYAPSAARVEVGLYDFRTGERLSITDCELRIANCSPSSDALTLSSISIAANPGEIPNPQSLNFNNEIELAGYKLDRRVAASGERLTLTLYWRGLKRISANYSVFTHVRGEGESIWAQMDSWPRRGAAPTSSWTPGALIEDTYDLALDAGTPPGVYDIEIGLYDSAGDRLQLITPDGRLADNFAYLSKVRVIAP
ncbi:MAG: glycosyltransferase family 39 protein [Chloroflexi bacterium]|nr:glycosyltransferase family 39 protein [Chloroflexota bacterium]